MDLSLEEFVIVKHQLIIRIEKGIHNQCRIGNVENVANLIDSGIDLNVSCISLLLFHSF